MEKIILAFLAVFLIALLFIVAKSRKRYPNSNIYIIKHNDINFIWTPSKESQYEGYLKYSEAKSGGIFIAHVGILGVYKCDDHKCMLSIARTFDLESALEKFIQENW